MIIKKITILPPEAKIINYLPADYNDIFYCTLKTSSPKKSIEILNFFFNNQPKWIKYLFKLRDLLITPFGLKKGDLNNKELKLGTILHNTENETILQLNDKHLTAELTIITDTCYTNEQKIYFITLVHFHNTFGKFYFFFIKPFHKLIVKSFIKHNIPSLIN